MAYIVLAAWLIQSAVGVALLARRLRHSRTGDVSLVVHVALGILSLAAWIGFVLWGAVVLAWTAFVLITVGNAIGDSMMVRRFRRARGYERGFWADYGSAIAAVFRGAMPRAVIFHALFAGVVYFLCLGVCIGATMAAAG